MYDTIKIIGELNSIPKQIKDLQLTPFNWNGFLWIPHFRDSNVPLYYKSTFKNISLRIIENQLHVINSLHKFYHGNNYKLFTYKQVCRAFAILNNNLPIDVYKAKVLKLSVGVVIIENPQKIFDEWLYYYGKPYIPMKNKNKIYGAKFFLTDYYIKGYDKTYEVKQHNKINLNVNYFRFEIEGKINIFNNKTNNVGIYTVNDLLDKTKFNRLGEVLLEKYIQIEKQPKLDLTKLTLKEKRLVASMRNHEVKENIRKQHKDTYKKDRKEYNKLINNLDNSTFQNQVISKLNQQIQYSINN